MYQQERFRLIEDILKQNGFVTVKYLMNKLHYSSATINRDLNAMQKQGIVKRSFGGAQLIEENNISLYFRYSKMRPIKNKIGKKAADFIKDGDTIFIDCSTTAQYIGKYITERKDITVITNNLTLASFLSENKITSICLGGKIMEPPSMIYSEETVESAKKYGADKFFFSASGITENGKIAAAKFDAHTLLIKTMMENSKEKFLLIDHEKLKPNLNKFIGDLDGINVVITDHHFPTKVKNNYSNTEFIEI